MTRTKSTSANIRDVARQAGVSVATVSRYLNHTGNVSKEVAARLEQTMAELNYVPHATARNLATHKTHTIGLLTTDIAGDFFPPLLSGIEEIASETGFDLLVSSARGPTRRHAFPPPLSSLNTDGILVFADSLDTHILDRLAGNRFPMVLIHQSSPDGFGIPCVTIENKDASYSLVDHLITRHLRQRIVFLQGPPGQEDSQWRELGYRSALETHGIPFDPSLVLPGEFRRTVARQSIMKLLTSATPFDAVFSGDDEAAVGVLAALHEVGKRVPEDISVVGFDDQSMAPYLTPPLTTVRAPTKEVGRTAARQLVDLIHGEGIDSLVLLPTELVIRRSCGCGITD